MRHGSATGGSSDAGMKASGTRANALWGKGKRRYSLLLAIAVAGGLGHGGRHDDDGRGGDEHRVSCRSLCATAPRRTPSETFQVIVQSSETRKTGQLSGCRRTGPEVAARQGKGAEAEVRPDPERDGGGHGRPARRAGGSRRRSRRDRGHPRRRQRLRQPPDVGVDGRRSVGCSAFRHVLSDDCSRRLGRPGSHRLRQPAQEAGRLHLGHRPELERRRLRSRHARGRTRGRRERSATRVSSRAAGSCRSTSSTTPGPAR